MNYALCPRVSLDEIVRQTRACLAWAFANARAFGADPERLTVSGHSAGGHLAAMALATDWAGDYDLPETIVKGAAAISGLYDLGFLPYCYVQPKVQATWDQVSRLSPARHLPERAPPLVVAVGGEETAEFRRQSRDFHAAWCARGLQGTYLEPPGKDHFSVLEELEWPDSELHTLLVRLAQGA
jgi:arylformamidase